MTMNWRRCSTAIGPTGGLIGFTPLSVTAMVPVEAHLILISQKDASAMVLCPSPSVAEHPLAGGTSPTHSVRLCQRINLRWWGSR